MSTKSVAQKLLIKPNTSLWLSEPDQRARMEPLPDGVEMRRQMADATTAVVFAPDSASLRMVLDEHRDHLTKPAAFWVAYPKGNRTDINRDSLWPILADYGMRPITQVAVDDVWSALRFRPLKKGEEHFTVGRAS